MFIYTQTWTRKINERIWKVSIETKEIEFRRNWGVFTKRSVRRHGRFSNRRVIQISRVCSWSIEAFVFNSLEIANINFDNIYLALAYKYNWWIGNRLRGGDAPEWRNVVLRPDESIQIKHMEITVRGYTGGKTKQIVVKNQACRQIDEIRYFNHIYTN